MPHFHKRTFVTSVIIFAGFITVSVWCFMNIGNWLSRADTVVPVDLIVCLSGSKQRAHRAVELYHQGIAPEILFTGRKQRGPLLKIGIAADKLHLAPNAKTTYDEAVTARRFIQSHSRIRAAVIVTDPFHLYRTRWSFRNVFVNSGVKLLFVGSDVKWTASTWYKKPYSRYLVASEVSKTLFYWGYHQLLGREETAPWVFELKQRYLLWLSKVC